MNDAPKPVAQHWPPRRRGPHQISQIFSLLPPSSGRRLRRASFRNLNVHACKAIEPGVALIEVTPPFLPHGFAFGALPIEGALKRLIRRQCVPSLSARTILRNRPPCQPRQIRCEVDRTMGGDHEFDSIAISEPDGLCVVFDDGGGSFRQCPTNRAG